MRNAEAIMIGVFKSFKVTKGFRKRNVTPFLR